MKCSSCVHRPSLDFNKQQQDCHFIMFVCFQFIVLKNVAYAYLVTFNLVVVFLILKHGIMHFG